MPCMHALFDLESMAYLKWLGFPFFYTFYLLVNTLQHYSFSKAFQWLPTAKSAFKEIHTDIFYVYIKLFPNDFHFSFQDKNLITFILWKRGQEKSHDSQIAQTIWLWQDKTFSSHYSLECAPLFLYFQTKH